MQKNHISVKFIENIIHVNFNLATGPLSNSDFPLGLLDLTEITFIGMTISYLLAGPCLNLSLNLS